MPNYMEPLRERLTSEHHRICKLLDVMIAILLYADDVALPADSIEDLIVSARILEEFCNDARLFISFPTASSQYSTTRKITGLSIGDGSVFVDGK